MKKPYWMWYWGKNQSDLTNHSRPKIFYDFDKMKIYSGKHSFKYQDKYNYYWSNYEKIE